MSKKHRGNQNWCRPVPYSTLPRYPSMWERLLESQHLSEDNQVEIMKSPTVRSFIHRNKHKRYVPEWALKAVGVDLTFFEDEIYARP